MKRENGKLEVPDPETGEIILVEPSTLEEVVRADDFSSVLNFNSVNGSPAKKDSFCLERKFDSGSE